MRISYRPKISNCLLWAVITRFKLGRGKIIITRDSNRWWGKLHIWLLLPEGQYSYTPRNRTRIKFWHTYRIIAFRGTVVFLKHKQKGSDN